MKCRRALARALPVISLALLLVPVADRALAVEDPVLVAAGDIANCNRASDEATAALLDQIPGTIATLGDSVYPNGTGANFANCFNPSWGRHKARIRPAIGNHDYLPSGAPGYYNYFGAAAGPRPLGYYSYDLGAWHIVVLNSNCGRVLGGCGPGSPQMQWLRADLAAHQANCTLAYWHHARYSSDRAHGNTGAMAPLFDVLYRNGAEVVLSGHAHTYERFTPQNGGGLPDPAFGVRQFVVGTGGAGHYSFGPPRANSEARDANTWGVIKLTLHPNSYDWQFVPVAGATFTDSGTGSCHGAPPAPPPTPPTTTPPTTTPPTTTPPTTTPPTTTPPPAPSKIKFRGVASSASDNPRASLTIDRPAGTKEGDVMVASVVANDNDPLAPPPGWTAIRTDVVKDAVRQDIYYRVAKANDPASFTWTLGRNRRLAGAISTYSGVDAARPVDADGAKLESAGGATLTAPSITTTTQGAMLIALVAVNSDGTISAPAGMTERWEVASRFPGQPRSAVTEGSDEILTAAGATGTRRATTSTAGAGIAALVALRPAP
jgi:calcineurin-like phosphoesterase family protein